MAGPPSSAAPGGAAAAERTTPTTVECPAAIKRQQWQTGSPMHVWLVLIATQLVHPKKIFTFASTTCLHAYRIFSLQNTEIKSKGPQL